MTSSSTVSRNAHHIDLSGRFRLTAILLAGITFFCALALYLLIAARLSDNTQVNESGRQRMLSQRVAWFGGQLVAEQDPQQRESLRKELREAATHLLSVHQRLLAWHYSWPQQRSAAVRSIYFGNSNNGLDAQLTEFVHRAQALADAPDSQLIPGNTDVLFLAQQASERLLQKLDDLTAQYERDNEAALVRLQYMQVATLLAAGLAMLAVVGLLLFQPARNRLQTVAQSLAAKSERLRRRERALATLHGLYDALNRHQEEIPLLEAVCQVIVANDGYPMAWVGYAGKNPVKSVRPVAYAGDDTGYLSSITVTWDDSEHGRGPVGSAIRTNTPSIVREVRSASEFAPWREAALERGYEAVIALPLIVADRAIGALVVYGPEPDAFDEDECAVLSDLAGELAHGIDAVRTRNAKREAERQLAFERECSHVLYQVLSLAQTDKPLRDKLGDVLDVLFAVDWLKIENKGAIFRTTEDGCHLRMMAQRGLPKMLCSSCAEIPFGHCLCGMAAERGELVFHAHLSDEHTVTIAGMRDHGHYCQPICSGDEVLGVLNLYVEAGHESTDVEAPFLAAIADTLAGILERARAEQRRQRLAEILEASPEFVCVADEHGHPCYYNAGARTLLGIAGDNGAPGRELDDDYPVHAVQRLREEAFPVAEAKGLWQGESVLLGSGGEEIPVLQSVLVHRFSDDDNVYFSTLAHDIRDRKRAELEAQTAAVREKHFANVIINGLPGIFFLANGSGRLLRWNSNLESAVGYSANELADLSIYDLLLPEDRETLKNAIEHVSEGNDTEIEVEFLGCNGQSAPYFISITHVMYHEMDTVAVAGMGVDISYRKRLEAELKIRATTDALTGAFNRIRMEEVLEHEMQAAQRYGTPLSIVLFDIDHFKQVNDMHGHDVGDQVLQVVVTQAQATLRKADMLGRWGGEEFIVVSTQTSLSSAQQMAEKIREAISTSNIEGIRSVTASFGVVQLKNEKSPRLLVKRADEALYKAKDAGRNCVVVDRSAESV